MTMLVSIEKVISTKKLRNFRKISSTKAEDNNQRGGEREK